MLRGYRFLVTAACGLTLAVALATGAFFGSLYSPSHKQYQTVAGNQRGQNDYAGPSQSLPDVSGLPGPVERAIANPHPATGEDHEIRNLAAQEASALWAFWMVVASLASVLITAVGTIFLYKQIVLTREAVEDTGKATAAMEESNEIARDTAKRQLRAYCGVLSFDGQGIALHAEPTFVLTVVNTGQTPAKRLKIDTTCWLSPAGQPGYSVDVAHYAEVTVGSGKTISSRAVLGYKLSQDNLDSLLAGTVVLYVGIYGEYVDIFDEPQSFYTVSRGVGFQGQFTLMPVPGYDRCT